MTDWLELILKHGESINPKITEASRLALKNPRMEFRVRLYSDGEVNIQAFSNLDADHEPGLDAIDAYQMSYHKWDVISVIEMIKERFYELSGDPRWAERKMLLNLIDKCLDTIHCHCHPDEYEDGDLLLQNLVYYPEIYNAFYKLVDYIHDNGMVTYVV